jgi:hypothetical protein
MFVKPLSKYNKTTKERYSLYQLCESYRLDDRVRQRVIIGLGKLEELPTDEQKIRLGKRIQEMIQGKTHLLIEEPDKQVERLAHHFYKEIRKKQRYDVKQIGQDWQVVDVNTVKNKDAREIGGEWLCKQAFEQLKISDFLRSANWPEQKIALATTHLISRAIYPASELKTVSFIKENSAVCELTGYEKDKITKDKLYDISKELYSIKDQLESYLSRKTNELFDLDDKIILYDLTNTYFEGQMIKSKKAKFGRSKEKRKDAKLVVLAIVVNREGFLKYSNIFRGNMADSKTLKALVKTIGSATSFWQRKPVVVMDAGIATDDNLKMLRKEGYDYMCVSRSNLKNYQADTDKKPVEIFDKRKQPIELMRVRSPDEQDKDNYLWVKSKAKTLKENSMNGLLSQRFEQGIQSIGEGIHKKGGTKKLDKVNQRIGRLKEKYPSVHRYYDITITDDGKGTATAISCRHKTGEDPDKKAGIYFLRTTLNENDEKTLWSIYNVIREIEYTFRVLKTDLDLRPVYHKSDEALMAHLHLGLLAYWLVSTIRYQLKQKGYKHQWREIVRIMNTQKLVTTSLKNIDNQTIIIRQCTIPQQKAKQIYDILKYKYVPFHRKKSVVVPAEILKNDSS